MRDKETGLTERQLAFAKAYAIEPNAAKAYLAAGYKSPKNARMHGYHLLQNEKVLAVIKAEQDKNAIKCELSRHEIIESIKHGMAEARRRGTLTALARFTELGARHLGMLTDNVSTIDVVKQRELDDKEKVEAAEIAKIRLRKIG